jgi:high-affinity nickel-transport protein
VILIVLGVANLRALGRPRQAHPSPDAVHAHGAATGSSRRAFAIGIAHGLGGSAAVALLALASMPTPASAVVYLAIFGLGTVLGMVALSLLLGFPLIAASRTPVLSRWVLGGSGAVSICVGLYVAYSVGTSALPL